LSNAATGREHIVGATTFSDTITTLEQLRQVIPPPNELAVRKQISRLDEHCREFIARSPFLFLATSNARGDCDVSPKGDAPGFVQVLDDETIVIPDRPGNNRLDSLTNILENPHAGVLFLIPGADWTLRVGGRASIVRDADVLEQCAVAGKPPALAIALKVEEAFLHCPKCVLRSNLWDSDAWSHKDDLSFAQVVRDHVKLENVPVDVVQQALDKLHETLY
jgi:PPOX class probable FMN-dependent enzyme